MKLKSFIFLFLLSGNILSQSSFQDRLNNIEGIKVSRITSEVGYSECYKIMIQQPIDHRDTTQGFFYQKVFLSHKSIDDPMVMNVNGYISFSNKISDWTKALQSNQLYVEHRFFGESKPDSINYQYLNILNATKDLHRIKEIFSAIYKNGWISLGISKGGLTALSYRFFYPNDVDATIALSTSIKTTECDSSFFNFIDSLNEGQGCKMELESFQKLLLTDQKKILPHLRSYLDNAGKQYSRLGLKTIYEIGVLEIPFSIWQNGRGCSSVDYSLTNSKELFDEMNSAINGWFLTDDVFKKIDPYHSQALTELGYYCFPISRFSNVLQSDVDKLKPVQPVKGIETFYSNELMIQIKEWAESSGNQIIYISGGNDPYSKERIIPNEDLEVMSLLLKGKNHNQVNSGHVGEVELKEINELLKKWIRKYPRSNH